MFIRGKTASKRKTQVTNNIIPIYIQVNNYVPNNTSVL